MCVKWLLVSAAVLGSSLNVLAAEPPANAKAGIAAASAAKGAATDATLGTITLLARQVKVAQLQKELKDAQGNAASTGAPGSQAGASPTGGTPTQLVSGPLPTSLHAPAMAPLQQPQRPAVALIAGMGGALRAYTASGAELHLGTVMTLGDNSTWTVKSIKPQFVVFDVCPHVQAPARRPGRAKAPSTAQETTPACSTNRVAPASA
jgi:hypothetical protein